MCGRFAITLPPQAMRAIFRYQEQPNFPPRYNVAPTQPVPIVIGKPTASGGLERHLVLMRWGFLPHFVKDPKQFPLIINARCETLRAKASFRSASKRRRCLFIADAFYEWRRESETRAKVKRPYLFRRHDGAPLAFGGLWETWTGPNGEEQDTACIITTPANGATAAIHDRLPAILEPAVFDLWLDPDETEADAALGALRPPENDVLDFFEIGPAVNKVEHDFPEVQQPIDPVSAVRQHPPQNPPPAAKPIQAGLFDGDP